MASGRAILGFMRPGTEHLWAAGAGILVVGWGAKSVMWSSVWGTVSETLAVQQKQNVAHYDHAREKAKKYQIPKEYLEGIDFSKVEKVKISPEQLPEPSARSKASE